VLPLPKFSMSFSLADAIFWIAVAWCVVAQLAIVRSVVISPARVGDNSPTSAARRAAEIGWAVLPGVALAVVLVFTWRAMHGVASSSVVGAVFPR
jgi:heme/copper-type cytochrome/quinol oxidase subunit 2